MVLEPDVQILEFGVVLTEAVDVRFRCESKGAQYFCKAIGKLGAVMWRAQENKTTDPAGYGLVFTDCAEIRLLQRLVSTLNGEQKHVPTSLATKPPIE